MTREVGRIAPRERGQASFVPTEIADSSLLAPRRVIAVTLQDGETLALRCHGNPSGPRLLLSHGNGMAADLYYPFWRHFLTDCEVLTYDLRNHGWNRNGDLAQHTMANFVHDTEAVFEAVERELGLKPTLGIFHSLSAIVAMMHALRAPSRWAALALFEPPILPPPAHELAGVFRASQIALKERTLSRQDCYASYDEFAGVLRRSSAFGGMVDAAFELYAAATFRRGDDGGVVLRCPRDLEAQIYVDNDDSTLGLALPHSPVPIKVVSGDPTLSEAALPSRVCASLFPGWGMGYEYVPGTSHFLQLEAPEACARVARRFFCVHGLMPMVPS